MMTKSITRMNRIGMNFRLTGNQTETKIALNTKSITVPVAIDVLSQAWHDWMMRGDYIQKAFSMLDAEQREFILSGVTPEDWKKLFGKDE